ncbi:hypothetical protein [Nocardia sp. Root136]|uniref:hypothetical protein n=1 Tax=Nocardia sp. Root136 TaxID=1736458 RepID=UPI000A470B9C|nr:hypothetical protein [Nocardia sp. Root136]
MGNETPWSGLAGRAKVRVETGAALDAAKACSDAIEVFNACLKIVSAENFGHFDGEKLGGSEVIAGPLLATRFEIEAWDAKECLERHVDSLTDMMDLFKSAGDTYTGADHMSSTEIAALKADKTKLGDVKPSTAEQDKLGTSMGKKGDDYRPGYYDADDVKRHEADVDVATVPKVKTTAKPKEIEPIDVASPESMNWGELHRLGVRIQWAQVGDAATVWANMATEVYKAASQLEVKLQKITTESWESQGGDTALQAIKTYAKSVYELSGGFRMTEANLRYTADWLYSTKVAMPLSESEPRGCGDDEGDKREAYRIHYVDGLSHTEKLFPVFTEPAAPAGPVEKPKDRPSDNGQNPSDKPSGTQQPSGNQGGGSQGGGGSQQGGGGSQQGGSGQQSAGSAQSPAQPQITPEGQAAQKTAEQIQAGVIPSTPTGTGSTGTGSTGSGSTGTGSSSATNPATGASRAGIVGQQTGSTQTGSGSGSGTEMLSSLMSAVTSTVSSLSEALPSVLTALQQISTDVTAGLPDLSQLGSVFEQFPDLAAILSDSPEVNSLISANPALEPLAAMLGIEVGDAPAVTEPAETTSELPETASAAGAFPRASLPDFSNLLPSLEEVGAPLTGLVAAAPQAEVVPLVEAFDGGDGSSASAARLVAGE